MAPRSPRLTLVVTPAAARDLSGIWDYNAEVYGPDHADRYLEFLDGRTRQLETDPTKGKPVPERPDLRYLIIRRRRGAGHVAVYRVRDQTVEIGRYFHTA